MSSFNKIIFSVLSVFLCFAIILGVITKKSYVCLDFDASLFENATIDQFFEPYENPEQEIQNEINDYLSQVDFVAKVKFTGERENRYYSALSTVAVIKVYRGDEKYEGNKIKIYEQFAFDNNRCILYTGFLPMQKNEEYYVFLKKRDYIETYQKTLASDEFSIYCRNFGCFRTQNKPLPIINKDKENLKDVREYDFLYHSTEDFNQCMDMKNMVMQYFDIEYKYPYYDELKL